MARKKNILDNVSMVLTRYGVRESEYTRALRARLKLARESVGASQANIAKALGMKNTDAYAKYENRPGSELPMRYLQSFCAATNCDPQWLIQPPTDALTLPSRKASRKPPVKSQG